MARPKTVSVAKVWKDLAVDAAEVGAAACLDVEVDVLGAVKGHPVKVWAESLTTNIGICNEHCSAANKVKFRLVNPTAGAINPASLTFRIVQF